MHILSHNQKLAYICELNTDGITESTNMWIFTMEDTLPFIEIVLM
jgi:hypothetical protein